MIEPQHAYNAGSLTAAILNRWSRSRLREASPIGDTYVSSIIGVTGELLTVILNPDGSGSATMHTEAGDRAEESWSFFFDAPAAIWQLTDPHEHF